MGGGFSTQRSILGWCKCAAPVLLIASMSAAEYRGQVKFNGLPLPGATVTAVQAGKQYTAISGGQGDYALPGLAEGPLKIQVEMLCFTTITQDATVASEAAPAVWEMKLLPLDQMKAVAAAVAPKPVAPVVAEAPKKGKIPVPTAQTTAGGFQRAVLSAKSAPPADPPPPSDASVFANQDQNELKEKAADGFLINGTRNNGASTQFSLGPAFGNHRRGERSLYNGNIGLTFDNSAFDARTYSLTGQDTEKPSFNHLTGLLSFGGPLKIPGLLKNGPNLSVNYQWTRQRNAVSQPGLMPTAAQRSGDFSQKIPVVIDPASSLPFPGGLIPPTRISPQAKQLLTLYPLPNFTGSTRYNYQIPVLGALHQDSLQTRANKGIGKKDTLSGQFAFQSTRSDDSNLVGFLDTGNTTGMNTNVSWRHTYKPRLFVTLGYQFSRQTARIAPFFANRQNVSGNAGISGNNQDHTNWGPPNLTFASGITPLYDAQSSFTRNQTNGLSVETFYYRGRHNMTFGGDYRKIQSNLLSQQDPRGSFTFTGASTGTQSDFASFLLGKPDTSSIAFGNADKYLRSSASDLFFTDDWRIGPGLTLNAGARWEYGSPIKERYGRLVNLDIAPGYSAQVPVIGKNPIGALTGRHFPESLVAPTRNAIQPRIGVSWRPLPASSMVIRGGYGIYYNTSAYQLIARQMSQQAPLSRSLSVANTAADPLTLADGFKTSSATTPATFAIDPNFRVGYAQNWQLSVQRDLPHSMIITGTYLGIKGTRGVQQSLPNTYPDGAPVICPACPRGFTYLSSNGNSTRHAGTVQLRRRMSSGFTASAQYTFAKAIDDSALGGRGQSGSLIAQDWLNLRGERGLSNFDQRHLLVFQTQYSTGMGTKGGALLRGARGTLLRGWTVVAQVNSGSGLPLNPSYISAVNGTGVTSSIRPDYTAAPLYSAPPGLSLNPAAFAAPARGSWGNAGRNSIRGPVQFTTTATMSRTFRLTAKYNMDLRVDSSNPLNHVTFPSWNANINSAQFGLPMSANAMRSLQTTIRVRF